MREVSNLLEQKSLSVPCDLQSSSMREYIHATKVVGTSRKGMSKFVKILNLKKKDGRPKTYACSNCYSRKAQIKPCLYFAAFSTKFDYSETRCKGNGLRAIRKPWAYI